MNRRRALWYGVAGLLLALDQTTKWIALERLAPGESIQVLPFLAWTFTCNEGAAFSMFQGYGWLLAAIAAVVSGFLVFEIWRITGSGAHAEAVGRSRAIAESAGCAFILAGALGNLADRLRHSCVVDFVHVRYGWFDYPVFNVADSAITVGAGIWIAVLLFGGGERSSGTK